MVGVWKVFWEENRPQINETLSTNFLIEPPKRVLPKDSHYFLLDPINALYTGMFDCSIVLSGGPSSHGSYGQILNLFEKHMGVSGRPDRK